MLRGASGSAVILASGRASTESLGLVRRLVDRFEVTAAVQVPLGDEAPLPGIPNLALRRERAPNLAGAELLGYTPNWEAAMRQARRGGRRHRARCRPQRSRRGGARRPRQAPWSCSARWSATRLRNAELVLPVTTMAEENGTYVNRDRRVQRFTQAKSQPGMARPAWWVAGEVLAGPGPERGRPVDRRRGLRAAGRSGGRCSPASTYADLGFTGRVLQGGAAPAFAAEAADDARR